MELRKDFINRMQWMVAEIKQSKLDDSYILSMLEFQLMQREKLLIRDVKRKVIGEQEMKDDKQVSASYVIRKGNDKFLDIIEDL
jgi:hypothetical protein|tara:strand:- start:485 stop:736 length:252 start_codon:yes stop_codon:yes gene_type:complete